MGLMKDRSQKPGSLVPRIARRRRRHIGKLWGLIGAVVICANAEYMLGDVLGLNLERDFRLILGTALVIGMFLGGLAAAFLMRPGISAEDVAGRAHPSRGRDS